MSGVDGFAYGFGRPVPHGTENKYRRGCRCGECRAANAERGRRHRAQKANWKASVPDEVHGTINGYSNYSCRCDDCKAANTEKKRRAYQERLAFRESLAHLRERAEQSA